ncbi:hypothetical protein [Pseudoroseomonas cervicalis]|uniref:hypothetical protein n=1 Tax=Teichococcus cervicalis TaxID=204525 RepID=UPI0022F1467D|nr:hypothetical protein [Pseudoroseomonas cervicalis]WBV44538.1 hypothetical protein PFY06_08280 [Pseudoroseomonas cervicalis]
MESLQKHHEVALVGHGAGALWWKKPRWDVIHLQWPESLTGWVAPTAADLQKIDAILEWHSRISPIVLTVHNYQPMATMAEAGRELFRVVLRHCSGFVHLGRSSIAEYQQIHQDVAAVAEGSHTVIEHGDYSYYHRLEERAEEDLRQILASIHPDETVFLVFGVLRDAREEELAREAFLMAGLPDARLLFAGTFGGSAISWNERRQLEQATPPSIARCHRRIADEEVALLFKRADAVLIPRSGRLNSGVIPLAYTYGKPAIGPTGGTIEEEVRAGGGADLVYASGDAVDAAAALRRLYRMDRPERAAIRERIDRYCRETLSWQVVSRKHLEFYKYLISRH